jgi:ribulose-5-phosphate 4-epimerase/fuculose-1-phosphate aldolase
VTTTTAKREVDVKREVAIANRVLWATGLCAGITASLGHGSMRLPDQPDRFMVKGRGYKMDALAAMLPRDMVTCDLDGNLLDGPPGATQCFEVTMHAWMYKLYPEVRSVVHVHPRFTVLMSTRGRPLKPMCQEGMELVAQPLPMYPHVKIVVTDQEGEEVGRLIGGFEAVLLQGHGATTIGASLEEAVRNMLHLEEQARMNDYALPHFREPFARAQGQPRVGGLWQYDTAQVSQDL